MSTVQPKTSKIAEVIDPSASPLTINFQRTLRGQTIWISVDAGTDVVESITDDANNSYVLGHSPVYPVWVAKSARPASSITVTTRYGQRVKWTAVHAFTPAPPPQRMIPSRYAADGLTIMWSPPS
jgi:hypothetical protein